MRPDPTLEQMLHDLGRALSDAMSESPDVHATLAKIRHQGYTVQLLLDCTTGPDKECEPHREETKRVEKRVEKRVNPSFVINASDLSFLRSVGIDPTRRLRRRRSRS